VAFRPSLPESSAFSGESYVSDERKLNAKANWVKSKGFFVKRLKRLSGLAGFSVTFARAAANARY
jgi:hypothetical protein